MTKHSRSESLFADSHMGLAGHQADSASSTLEMYSTLNERKLNSWLPPIVVVAVFITIRGAPWTLEGWGTVNPGLVGAMLAILAVLDLAYPDRLAVYLHPAKEMWSVARRRVLCSMTARTFAACGQA